MLQAVIKENLVRVTWNLRPNSKPRRDLLTGIAPGGFESSGTTIPEGRRARPHAVLPHLPSDCHRPRAIAGEAASARAQAFARDPSRCRQRQPCARQTVARASLEEILGPSPRKPTTLFFGHLTPGGRAWAGQAQQVLKKFVRLASAFPSPPEREPRRAGEGTCLESKLLRPDRLSPVGSKK